MYGTIPLVASFFKMGICDSWLSAFMMSSILLNPQIIVYSATLGGTVMAVRIVFSFFCGITVGVLLHVFYKDKAFFNFSGFEEPKSCDTDPILLIRYLKDLGRNVKATGSYFLAGVLLSALFQRYVPAETMTVLFDGNEAFAVLIAATIGGRSTPVAAGPFPFYRADF